MILDAVANFHFIRPGWLLLTPIIVGLWWVRRRQSDPLRGWRAQMDPELLQALTVAEGARQGGIASWWLLGWMLALAAIAGPTWRLEPSPFAEDAAPLMILLKAGDSMDGGDVPTSPIERAKLKITDLADLRKGQPLGLIAYAGSAHLVLPPTRDTSVVAQMAGEIGPDVMPVPGNRLDLALQRAAETLSSEKAGGTLLVIADSVEMETDANAQVWGKSEKFPVQFLALTDEGTPESASIDKAAGTLNATVQHLTIDDQDVTKLVHAAARRSPASLGGKSNRWQEAGYWLVPFIAVLVALSFRREALATEEEIA